MKQKESKEGRLVIKMAICLVYLISITILLVCSYRLFEEKKNIPSWSQAKTTQDYTYIDIYKMSEKFAYYKETNVGIHFVIEKEETGMWHTYLIAINEDEYEKYKAIIDYTYERTEQVPDQIRAYGYPVIIDEELKQLAIKNIPNFIPRDNEVTITNENYEEYLTNSYLDTTKEEKHSFSMLLCFSLILLFTVIALFLLTIFDKDKIVDNIEEDFEKTKRLWKIKE